LVYKDTGNAFIAIFYNRTNDYKNYQNDYGETVSNRLHATTLILQKTLLPRAPYGNFPFISFPFDGILFIAGILFFIGRFFHKSREPENVFLSAIIPLWTFVTFGCLILYLLNDWARYYLPFTAMVTLIEGCGAYYFLQKVYFALRRMFT
jgi:hypothetical protein